MSLHLKGRRDIFSTFLSSTLYKVELKSAALKVFFQECGGIEARLVPEAMGLLNKEIGREGKDWEAPQIEAFFGFVRANRGKRGGQ
jgi:hypothetical protein